MQKSFNNKQEDNNIVLYNNIDRAELNNYIPGPTRVGDNLPNMFEEDKIERDAYRRLPTLIKEQPVTFGSMPYNTKVFRRSDDAYVIPPTTYEQRMNRGDFTTFYYKLNDDPCNYNQFCKKNGTGLQDRSSLYTDSDTTLLQKK